MRAAKILFELDDLSAGEEFGKFEHVAKGRAAKRIDRLRLVADNRDVIVRGGKQTDDLRLQLVGVLILVDHHVAILLR